MIYREAFDGFCLPIKKESKEEILQAWKEGYGESFVQFVCSEEEKIEPFYPGVCAEKYPPDENMCFKKELSSSEKQYAEKCCYFIFERSTDVVTNCVPSNSSINYNSINVICDDSPSGGENNQNNEGTAEEDEISINDAEGTNSTKNSSLNYIQNKLLINLLKLVLFIFI